MYASYVTVSLINNTPACLASQVVRQHIIYGSSVFCWITIIIYIG